MRVNGKQYRTIWLKESNDRVIQIIDQRILPHTFEIVDLSTVDDVCVAIKDMYIRGAGLIGATAGYGMYLAALEASDTLFDIDILRSAQSLKDTRPTAANLAWAVDRQVLALQECSSVEEKRQKAKEMAGIIADEDAEFCRRIGENGLAIIEAISKAKGGKPVNILTHCNAGWLAFVDYGSATAPIYAAHKKGIPIHVWVDETRPRNQGASLTAWELGQEGVPHDLIVDNAGGHLMQHGMVDLVITGADRVTGSGDAANKIGTYLKALAAYDNDIPFYVALPSSTFDFSMRDGVVEIPIEERDSSEVRYMTGKLEDGSIATVQICPDTTPARNWGFDVTPARLIRGLIHERGISSATEESIASHFPEFFCVGDLS